MTQQEGSHLQAKERDLNRKQPCQHLNGLAASITEKINFHHFVIPAFGIVMPVLANKYNFGTEGNIWKYGIALELGDGRRLEEVWGTCYKESFV